MTASRTAATLFAAGALALAAGSATYYLTGGADRLAASQLTDEADVAGLLAARLPDSNGVETTLAAATEKVLVVNFWATWCEPCREEIPDFVRLQADFGARGVRFYGIAAERIDKIPAFAIRYGVNYPLLVADHAAIDLARKLGNKVGGLPFTIVLDANRGVVYRKLGIVDPTKLKSILADLL